MVPFTLTVCLLLIIAIADVSSLYCHSNCSSDTMEGNAVALKCELTDSGGRSPALKWYNEHMSELPGIPSQVRKDNIVSRNFFVRAEAPSVMPLICEADLPGEKCDTKLCNILYSVRNVKTWPLGLASPNETITCSADGNPKPEFKWQWQEIGAVGGWVDIPDEKEDTILAKLSENGNPVELRCVATNELNNKMNSANSLPLIVTEDGAAIRTKIIIGVVVGVVVLAIAVGVAYFFFK